MNSILQEDKNEGKLKSEKSQDYALKTQRNCTFINSISGICITSKERETWQVFFLLPKLLFEGVAGLFYTLCTLSQVHRHCVTNVCGKAWCKKYKSKKCPYIVYHCSHILSIFYRCLGLYDGEAEVSAGECRAGGHRHTRTCQQRCHFYRSS